MILNSKNYADILNPKFLKSTDLIWHGRKLKFYIK